MKMERMDKHKSFSAIFNEFSNKELIDLIINTESINKKYILRHFIDFKKREKKVLQKKEALRLKKWEEFEQLKPGDFILHDSKYTYNTCIIISKRAKTFTCREIGNITYNTIRIFSTPEYGHLRYGKYTTLCVLKEGMKTLNSWVQQKNLLNSATELHVDYNEEHYVLNHADILKKVLSVYAV